MRKLGSVVASSWPYYVVELCDRYPDGKLVVIGYHVRGPGCNPSWIYEHDAALTKMAALAREEPRS